MRKTINIRQLYEILNQQLGRQNWWPAKNTEQMLTGMILIQNTNWKNVDRSLANLDRITNFELDKLLALNIEQLKQLIQPSGFFNNKALYLQSIWQAYRDNFDDWSKLSTKELRKKLTAMKGIGNETADVLLLYYFDRSTFVADHYAMKLFDSMSAFSKKPTYIQLKNNVETDFDFTPDEASEFHALIDEYGKLKSDFFDDFHLQLPQPI